MRLISQWFCATAIAFMPGALLAQPGATPNTEQRAAESGFSLVDAVRNNDIDTARRLMESNPKLINQANKDNETALHWAAINGSVELVMALVENGALVDARTKDDWTPLHWAVLKGQKPVVRYLLDQKADIKAQTGDLWTPLHIAAYLENRDLLEMLVKAGADPEIKDKDGFTPLGVLREKSRPIVQVLIKAGAKDEQQAGKFADLEAKAREDVEKANVIAAKARADADAAMLGLEKTRVEAVNAKAELIRSTTRIQELEIALADARAHAANQPAQSNPVAQAEFDTLKPRMVALERSIKDSDKEIASLTKENSALRERAAAVEKDLKLARAKTADAVTSELKMKLDRSDLRIADLEKQIKTGEEIRADGEKMRQRMSELADQVKVNANRQAMEEELVAIKQKNEAMEKALKDSYSASQQFRKDWEAMKKANDELLAQLKVERNRKNDAGEKAIEALKVASQTISLLETRAKSAEKELKDALWAADQFREQFKIASRERSALEARLVNKSGAAPATVPATSSADAGESGALTPAMPRGR